MRVSIFLSEATGISADAERVVTIHDGQGPLSELNLYLGSGSAETAIIADRLIGVLEIVRSTARAKAILSTGTATFDAPFGAGESVEASRG